MIEERLNSRCSTLQLCLQHRSEVSTYSYCSQQYLSTSWSSHAEDISRNSDPQQLYGGLCGGKLNHKFSLGLGPNHLVLEVLPQCDAWYGYVRPITRLLGNEELRNDWSHIDVYSCYGLL